MNEALYNEACAFYHEAVMCCDEKKYGEAIVHLDKAIDSIKLLQDSKEPFNEEVNKEISQWFAARGIAKWFAKQYQPACFDIDAAVSWNSECREFKEVQGQFWHNLICSHEGRVSQNPYYNIYIRNSYGWKRIRNKRKEVDGDLCVCGQSYFGSGLPIVQFKVHHKTYERVGKEHLSDLIRLCEVCHEDYHRRVYYADTWPPYQPLP